MKTTMLISLGKDSFSNVSIEYEGVAEEAIAEGKRLVALAMQSERSLPDKEMTDFIYSQIYGTGNHVETWELMNNAQRTFVNQLKKALTRKPPLTTPLTTKNTL